MSQSVFCWWCSRALAENGRGSRTVKDNDGHDVTVHASCEDAAKQSALNITAAPPEWLYPGFRPGRIEEDEEAYGTNQ